MPLRLKRNMCRSDAVYDNLVACSRGAHEITQWGKLTFECLVRLHLDKFGKLDNLEGELVNACRACYKVWREGSTGSRSPVLLLNKAVDMMRARGAPAPVQTHSSFVAIQTIADQLLTVQLKVMAGKPLVHAVKQFIAAKASIPVDDADRLVQKPTRDAAWAKVEPRLATAAVDLGNGMDLLHLLQLFDSAYIPKAGSGDDDDDDDDDDDGGGGGGVAGAGAPAAATAATAPLQGAASKALYGQLCRSMELRHHLLSHADQSLLTAKQKPVTLVPRTSFVTHHVHLTGGDVKPLTNGLVFNEELAELFKPDAPSVKAVLDKFAACKLAGISVDPVTVHLRFEELVHRPAPTPPTATTPAATPASGAAPAAIACLNGSVDFRHVKPRTAAQRALTNRHVIRDPVRFNNGEAGLYSVDAAVGFNTQQFERDGGRVTAVDNGIDRVMSTYDNQGRRRYLDKRDYYGAWTQPRRSRPFDINAGPTVRATAAWTRAFLDGKRVQHGVIPAVVAEAEARLAGASRRVATLGEFLEHVDVFGAVSKRVHVCRRAWRDNDSEGWGSGAGQGRAGSSRRHVVDVSVPRVPCQVVPTLNGLYGSKARLTAAAIAADRKRSAMDTIVQTLAPQHSDIIVMGSGFLGCRATKGSTGGTPVVKVRRRGGVVPLRSLCTRGVTAGRSSCCPVCVRDALTGAGAAPGGSSPRRPRQRAHDEPEVPDVSVHRPRCARPTGGQQSQSDRHLSAVSHDGQPRRRREREHLHRVPTHCGVWLQAAVP